MPSLMPRSGITRRQWLHRCLYGSSGLAISLLTACNRGKMADNEAESPVDSSADSSKATPLTLTSPSLQAAFIPPQFTCDGANHSPELSWSNPPAQTQSWLLLLESEASAQPSAQPLGKLYWLVYDLPASLSHLPAALPNQPFLSQGGLQAKNDFGQYGYRGPCPADGSDRYQLRLYAVRSLLDLPPGVSPAAVKAALQSQILAETRLSLRVAPA